MKKNIQQLTTEQLTTEHLDTKKGKIAYQFYQSNADKENSSDTPLLVWCPGYLGTMAGGKASYILDWALANDHSILLFDYLGHGKSQGNFDELVFSHWHDNASKLLNFIVKEHSINKIFFMGSSMGGWIANLLALEFHERCKLLFMIAPAHDFPNKSWLPNLSESDKKSLTEKGYFTFADLDSKKEYKVSQRFFDDAANHTILDKPIKLDCYVHILHGDNDEIVTREHIIELVKKIDVKNIKVEYVDKADHGMSRIEDKKLILQRIIFYLEQVKFSKA